MRILIGWAGNHFMRDDVDVALMGLKKAKENMPGKDGIA